MIEKTISGTSRYFRWVKSISATFINATLITKKVSHSSKLDLDLQFLSFFLSLFPSLASCCPFSLSPLLCVSSSPDVLIMCLCSVSLSSSQVLMVERGLVLTSSGSCLASSLIIVSIIVHNCISTINIFCTYGCPGRGILPLLLFRMMSTPSPSPPLRPLMV